MKRHLDVFAHASCGRYFRYAQIVRRRSSKLGDHDAALPMSSKRMRGRKW
jgi:hypothetical protein